MNHYDNGHIVHDNVSEIRLTIVLGREGLMYDRENRVRKSDIPPSFKAFKINNHVELITVCHRTIEEKGMSLDCRRINKKT